VLAPADPATAAVPRPPADDAGDADDLFDPPRPDAEPAPAPAAGAMEQAALFALDQQQAVLRRPRSRAPGRGAQLYRLNRDLGIPESLRRETMRLDAGAAVACIARRVDFNDATMALVQRLTGRVTVSEEDLIAHSVARDVERFPLSEERIARAAQQRLALNDQISTRQLKPALVDRLRTEMDRRGLDIPDAAVLRRVVDLALLERPYLIDDALRACRADQIAVEQAEPLPEEMWGAPALEPAVRAAYGVIPDDLNTWETRFARMLDGDTTGNIRWWLRNVDRKPWAVRIALPTGRHFYPDFVVGVSGRPRADGVTLAEVKGRFESDDSIDKARTPHQVYGPAVMIHYQERAQSWVRIAYLDGLRQTQPSGTFHIEALVDP
jgi:hypothetical protein